MKKVLTMCVYVVAFSTLMLGAAIARRGPAIHHGGGLLNVVWCADAFIKSGTVQDSDTSCLSIQADGEPNEDPYMVCGLGPSYHWYVDGEKIQKPIVGDYVTIWIANCGTDNNPKYVALSISLYDDNGNSTVDLDLLDPETCRPQWIAD
jgi:hypothetical protein